MESFGLAKITSSGQGGSGPASAVDIDVEAYLTLVGIPISSKGQGQGLLPSPSTATAPTTQHEDRSGTPSQISHPNPITLPHEEALKKVGLIHKALVCLGDLERYKEQYGAERDKKSNGAMPDVGLDGNGAKFDEEDAGEVFGKAKKYYEVARGLLPDNGTCSGNSMVQPL